MLAILGLIVALGAAAHAAPSPITSAMRTAAYDIQDAALSRSLMGDDGAWDRLAELVDTFGPRFSGSDPLEAALDWLVSEMGQDGLNVTQEAVFVPRWVRGEETLLMTAPRNTSLHMVGLGGSAPTPGGQPLTAAVEVFESKEDFDQQVADNPTLVEGKLVLWNVPFTTYGSTVQYRSQGGVWASAHGAVGSLVRSVGPFSLQTPHTGGTANITIPQAAISIEDALMISRIRKRGQEVQLQLTMESHWAPERQSRNLIVVIEGSEFPDEYVVFGGHSDSWDIAPGAMDDGGGILSAWEAARLLHSLPYRPKRSVMAVMWVNEENGSRGGQAFAKMMGDKLNKTSFALESDIGAFTPYGIGFNGNEAATQQMLALAPLLSDLNATEVAIGEGEGEDISFSCAEGVPCVGLLVIDPRLSLRPNNPCQISIEASLKAGGIDPGQLLSVPGASRYYDAGYFNYHHTAADTPDKMDPLELQLSAAVIATWAFAVADLPDLLPRGGPAAAATPSPAPLGPYAERAGCSSPRTTDRLESAVIGLTVYGIVVTVAVVVLAARLWGPCCQRGGGGGGFRSMPSGSQDLARAPVVGLEQPSYGASASGAFESQAPYRG